jgi:hypothetical protein
MPCVESLEPQENSLKATKKPDSRRALRNKITTVHRIEQSSQRRRRLAPI